MYTQIRLGFNTRSNTQATGRTTNVVCLGKTRNTLASTTRKFNYCNRNSSNLASTLRCVFDLPSIPRPIFNDGQFQVAVGDNAFSISINYGRTWISKPEFAPYNLRSVAISNNGQYVLAGGAGTPLFYSNNGGQTFIQKFQPKSWFEIKMSKSGQYQTAIGPIDEAYVSNDYGNTFTVVSLSGIGSNTNFLAMSYDGKYQSITKLNEIYRSDDYGLTWSTILINSSPGLYGIAMSGNGQIQISADGGGNGLIYKSTDYGLTWVNSFILQASNSFYFISISETGQYQLLPDYGNGGTSGGGNIWISNDYGNTYTNLINIDGQPQLVFGFRGWYPSAVSASGKYQTVCDYDGLPGDNGGYIYTSEDYGQNWTVRPTSGTVQWWGMFMG
jgi:photosystem II stability/assembly factor-like uncharacterized protein